MLTRNNKKTLFTLCVACCCFVQGIQAESCSKIIYKPRTPLRVALNEINSVQDFSPSNLNKGWVTFDHIGYKDSAYQGERHVALTDEGIQFFGYDEEPLTDVMLLPHEPNQNQYINTVQAPVRADWHTLNGNGILFGCTFEGLTQEHLNSDINLCSNSTNQHNPTAIKVSGYSVVATLNKIEVRKYSNVSPEELGSNYETLFNTYKQCPGQNFTVEITNGIASVYQGSIKLYEFNLNTSGRGTGLITTYESHNCNSLSSVIMFNHTVNGIDYLKKPTAIPSTPSTSPTVTTTNLSTGHLFN